MNLADRNLRVLFFASVGHGLTHAYMILFTPLLSDVEQTFGLTTATVTAFITVANVCYGVGAVPAGWLADRFGDKALMVGFFYGCAAGALLISVAQSTWLLGVGVVILGTAASIYHPVGISMITRRIATRGRALGVNGIFGSVGTALGPAYAGIVAMWLSWQWAFVLLAVPTAMIGLWMSRVDLGSDMPPDEAPGPGAAAPAGSVALTRFTLFAFLLSAMALGGLFYHLMLTMLPTHLEQSGAWRRPSSGGVLAGFALAFGAGGQYVCGLLADRFEGRMLYFINLLVVIPAVWVLGYLTDHWLLAAACGAAFLMFGIQPIENTVIANHTPTRWRGRVYGAKFILVFSVGGCGSWLSGLISVHLGMSRVFDIAAIAVAGAMLCALVAWRIPLAARPASAAG
ncbi:MAG: hypothetical protein CMJ18_02345 [Phycisphaeraceae bacterium]|nr:hypothetical protein [Phycisphaeraceae bacterium]